MAGLNCIGSVISADTSGMADGLIPYARGAGIAQTPSHTTMTNALADTHKRLSHDSQIQQKAARFFNRIKLWVLNKLAAESTKARSE